LLAFSARNSCLINAYQRFLSAPPTLARVFFFFYCSGTHRHLHSFPTRRSSDLGILRAALLLGAGALVLDLLDGAEDAGHGEVDRSEEHTSELQSRGHLVCRLLLEKKKGPGRHLRVCRCHSWTTLHDICYVYLCR